MNRSRAIVFVSAALAIVAGAVATARPAPRSAGPDPSRHRCRTRPSGFRHRVLPAARRSRPDRCARSPAPRRTLPAARTRAQRAGRPGPGRSGGATLARQSAGAQQRGVARTRAGARRSAQVHRGAAVGGIPARRRSVGPGSAVTGRRDRPRTGQVPRSGHDLPGPGPSGSGTAGARPSGALGVVAWPFGARVGGNAQRARQGAPPGRHADGTAGMVRSPPRRDGDHGGTPWRRRSTSCDGARH